MSTLLEETAPSDKVPNFNIFNDRRCLVQFKLGGNENLQILDIIWSIFDLLKFSEIKDKRWMLKFMIV